MDTTNQFDSLSDEECVSMCMSCLARGVAIPEAVRRRVQQLGIWKLIVGATNGTYQYERDS